MYWATRLMVLIMKHYESENCRLRYMLLIWAHLWMSYLDWRSLMWQSVFCLRWAWGTTLLYNYLRYPIHVQLYYTGNGFTLRLMKHEFRRLRLNYSPILICNKKLMILAAFPPPDIYILCWFMNDVLYSAQSCVGWFISQTGFTVGSQLWKWSIDAFDRADVQTEGPTCHLCTFMLACTLINCSKWFWWCTLSTSHVPSRQTHVTVPLCFRCLYCSTEATSDMTSNDKMSVHFRLFNMTQKTHSGGKRWIRNQKLIFMHSMLRLSHSSFLWYNTSASFITPHNIMLFGSGLALCCINSSRFLQYL